MSDREVPSAEVVSPKPEPWHEPKWRVFAIVVVLSLVADQATKVWARHALPVEGHGSNSGMCVVPEDLVIVPPMCQGKSVTFITGYWDWRLAMNHGSAFGLFANSPDAARWLLSIVAIVATFAMLGMIRKARADQGILHVAIGLVVGGALGNLLDRVYFGAVTDFVLWHYQTHEWPVFNIADVGLVVGIGLMFIDAQRENKRKPKLSKKERQEKAKAAGLVKNMRE
jgi:signal peptidase II